MACQCGNDPLHSDSRAELLLFGTTLFLASGKRPFTSLVFNSLGGLFSGSRINNGLCFPSTSRGNKCACAPQRSTRHPPPATPTKFGVEFWLFRPQLHRFAWSNSSHFPVAYLPVHNIYAGISSEATTIPVLWRVPSTSHLSIGLYFPPIDSRRLSTTCCHRSVPSHKRAQNEPSYPQKITNDEEPAR